MWTNGRTVLSKTDAALAKRVKKGAPTVSARRIPPLTLSSEDAIFFPPHSRAHVCCFTASLAREAVRPGVNE